VNENGQRKRGPRDLKKTKNQSDNCPSANVRCARNPTAKRMRSDSTIGCESHCLPMVSISFLIANLSRLDRGKTQKKVDSAVENHESLAEGAFDLFV
jgi:hypothetical protein